MAGYFGHKLQANMGMEAVFFHTWLSPNVSVYERERERESTNQGELNRNTLLSLGAHANKQREGQRRHTMPVCSNRAKSEEFGVSRPKRV